MRFILGSALFIALCFAFEACGGSRQTNETPPNLIVLNAPASGTVRRVLVGEGVGVESGAPVIEIVVETASAPTANTNNSRNGAPSDSRTSIENLQREVERAAVEVSRVESLVGTNSAPQAQLDAARVEYQRAQERLQAARDRRPTIDNRLTAQGGNLTSANSTAREEIAYLRATTAGTVRVISVRAGQRVVSGQPLVTVSSGGR
jgi:multidrug efflux pump subunit AcrA (membrane-fusion protein)